MKKNTILQALVAFVCILSAGFALASCSSDDPDTPSGNDKVTHAQYTYKIMPTQAVLNIADISITYTDGNGKEQTEKVTSTSWSKTVTSKSLPATFKRTVTVTPKSGVDASAEYDVNIDYGYECLALSSGGKQVGAKNSHNEKVMAEGVSGANLGRYFKAVSESMSFSHTISASGDFQ